MISSRTALLLGTIVTITASAVLAADAPAPAGERQVRESPSYAKGRTSAPHTRTSAHFTLHWGDENKSNINIDEAYLTKAMAWLEDLWTLYIDKLHFPAGKHNFKINAYITGTGVKPFLDGYAFGFADPEGYGVLIGHPSIYTFGHNGAAHELTHALQGETKGFRDSDYVGWFWECHAQFLAHQPTGKGDLPHNMERYAQTPQWDLASTRHHYGSWIFPQFIAERFPDGMNLVNRIWIEPAKHKDEDAIAKLRRTLPFTGDRDKAWADLIGDFAKHNVTWNFYKLGADYRKSMRFFDEMDRRNYFTYLEPSPSRPGWHRVPRIYAPSEFGYNIIPLTPAPGASSVKVDLAGFVDPVLRSEWRATIVSFDAQFKERFSPTWATGTGTLDIKPGEKMFLVVAATPLSHHPPRFVENFTDLLYHPYEVRITGATPWNLSARIRPIPAGLKGHPHPNGGGFVADTAQVAPTAFVGKDAAVLDRAQVKDQARIEDFATVSGEAQVSGHAVVAGNALITRRAKVEEDALVTDFAELTDSALVHGRARVLAAGRVFGNNEITDEAVIKGFASIRGVKKVRGCAIADGEVEWDFNAPELATGIHFGTLLQRDPHPPESHHLYAHYGLSTDSAWRLRDDFGTNDGMLQGGAKLAADPERTRALVLSGTNQFVDLPRELALSRQLTFAAWIKADSPPANQTLAFFGKDDAHALELLAADSSGNLALRWRDGATRLDLAGSKLPAGKWVHVAVTLGDAGTTLYVDGKQVATKPASPSSPIHPDDVRPTVGYLGRGFTSNYLAARLTGLDVFTRALTADEVATLKEKGKL